MQVELKKQQKLCELEKENYIRKTQQYDDLLQEFRALKAIQDNFNSKLYDHKFFSNENKNLSPLTRKTYHTVNRASWNRKTLLITKAVQFQESLFGKNMTKSIDSSSPEEKDIKM